MQLLGTALRLGEFRSLGPTQRQRTLADLLVSLRQQKRFSRRALAAAAGVSNTHLSEVETSGLIPQAPFLRQLAEGLAQGDSDEEERIFRELMRAAFSLDTELAVEEFTPGWRDVQQQKVIREVVTWPRERVERLRKFLDSLLDTDDSEEERTLA